MEALGALGIALLTFVLTALNLNRNAGRDYTTDLEKQLAFERQEKVRLQAELTAADVERRRLERDLNHALSELDQFEKRG